MRQVYLIREPSSDQGTYGYWIADTRFFMYVLELPWRDNLRSRSCIPAGTYKVKIRKSAKYGLVYHVKDVRGRSWILTHSGNWAGDVDKGFKSHSEGCILTGFKKGTLQGQKAVLNSRSALKAFMRHMNNKDFQLTIIGGI